MGSIYTELGLPRVINGNGRMTKLGVSTFSETVGEALIRASKNYVVVDDLLDVIGKKISVYTTAEDTCVVCSAASGIAIAVAATIAKDSLALIEKMPRSEGMKNEVVIPKGHVVNFNAPISTMIGIGGGVLVEAGQANRVSVEHIEASITDKTCALMYVKSHHAVQKGMPSIKEMVAVAEKYKIPLILDAAAEEDLQKYVKMGADMVIYSGAKAICGPTSGIITGKKQLIAYCKAQYKGIGRAMKVSKETMVALHQAIVEYVKQDNAKIVADQKATLDYIAKGILEISSIKTSVEQDEAGREIYRLKIVVDDAARINNELKAGDISINLRDHYANIGILYIDPRGLVGDDKDAIIAKLKKVLGV